MIFEPVYIRCAVGQGDLWSETGARPCPSSILSASPSNIVARGTSAHLHEMRCPEAEATTPDNTRSTAARRSRAALFATAPKPEDGRTALTDSVNLVFFQGGWGKWCPPEGGRTGAIGLRNLRSTHLCGQPINDGSHAPKHVVRFDVSRWRRFYPFRGLATLLGINRLNSPWPRPQ